MSESRPHLLPSPFPASQPFVYSFMCYTRSHVTSNTITILTFSLITLSVTQNKVIQMCYKLYYILRLHPHCQKSERKGLEMRGEGIQRAARRQQQQQQRRRRIVIKEQTRCQKGKARKTLREEFSTKHR